MKMYLAYRNRYNSEMQQTIDIAARCPHCGHETHFQCLYGKQLDANIGFLLHCAGCDSFICCEVKGGSPFVYPARKVEFDLDQSLNEVSPRFVEIYRQAMQAKESGLFELVGMGLRKALEFLIFDYLSLTTAKEELQGLTLAQAIEKSDIRLKSTATLSSWIGNDNTHYFPRNPDLATDLLISYVRSVASHINSQYLDLKAAELISERTHKPTG